MSATLPVSLGRATPPSSEWTRCWTRKAWFRKSGIMKVTLATCLSLTPTFVRCREPTSAGRWPTFQGPPFQGSLDEAACWSSSRADPALRQRVDRAGMNLTPPTSPKPAETSESIALILFKSCRIVGCRFQEEDTHIQKDGKKRHWDTLRFVESHLKKPSPLLKKWQVTVTKLHVFFLNFPPWVSENAIPWWNMPLIFRWTSWAMQRWQRCASIRPRVLVSDPIGAKRLDTQSSDAWQAVAIHCYSDDEVPVEIR